MRGIDISNWQTGLDLKKAKGDGVSFAICKLSEGTTFADKQFNTFYEQAKAAGLPIGAYVFSHATTPSAAVSEVNYALQLLNGRDLPLGLFMDVETSEQMSLSSGQLAETVRAFVDTVENAGYISGIYGSEYQTWAKIDSCDYPDSIIWVAHYGKVPVLPCDIWQESDQGTYPGFSGHVDVDETMSERMERLVKSGQFSPSYTPPVKDPVGATFPPDPSVLILQLVMQYNGYWDEKPDGYKSEKFFQKLEEFIADMKKC